VYGDSLTKHLHNLLPVSSDIEYSVFTKPGATINLLEQLIYYHDVHEPYAVVLLVGTNSLANCGLMTTFIRHYKNLLTTVKAKFPSSMIYICEIPVRRAFSVAKYNHELAKLCRSDTGLIIRSNIEMRDIDSSDGLHLYADGDEVLADDIHSSVLRGRWQGQQRQRYTSCMVPPLWAPKKRKKKKEIKKEQKLKVSF